MSDEKPTESSKGKDAKRASTAKNPFAPTNVDYGDPKGMNKPGEPDYLHPEGTPVKSTGGQTENDEKFDYKKVAAECKPESSDMPSHGVASKKSSSSADSEEGTDSMQTESSADDSENADSERDSDPLARNDYSDPKRMTDGENFESDKSGEKQQGNIDYMHPDGKPNS